MLRNNIKTSNAVKRTVIFIILIAAIGYGVYEFYVFSEEVEQTRQDMEEVKSEYENEIDSLKQNLEELEQENTLLSEALQNEKERNESIQTIIDEVTDELDTFRRLDELDPELLKKYSKVYFLSEHYVPSSLTIIPEEYTYDEGQPVQVHSEVEPFLVDLLEAAERQDIELYVKSGYRSFGSQSDLKNNYVFQYGSESANTFSAEQGYSEHQLGTTVDFITTGINGTVDGFEETEAYQWLLDNAYRFGFILSYPENNDYYVFEPWHWRFVGTELSRDLNREDANFYDMDQRDIDEYLLNIFD